VRTVGAGDRLEALEAFEGGLAQALVALDAVRGARRLAFVVEVGASIGRIWVAKRSSAQARAARCWELRPNASQSARVMPYLSATRSAASNWEVNS